MKLLTIFLMCAVLTGCVKVDVYHSVSVDAECEDVDVYVTIRP